MNETPHRIAETILGSCLIAPSLHWIFYFPAMVFRSGVESDLMSSAFIQLSLNNVTTTVPLFQNASMLLITCGMLSQTFRLESLNMTFNTLNQVSQGSWSTLLSLEQTVGDQLEIAHARKILTRSFRISRIWRQL